VTRKRRVLRSLVAHWCLPTGEAEQRLTRLREELETGRISAFGSSRRACVTPTVPDAPWLSGDGLGALGGGPVRSLLPRRGGAALFLPFRPYSETRLHPGEAEQRLERLRVEVGGLASRHFRSTRVGPWNPERTIQDSVEGDSMATESDGSQRSVIGDGA
jgi:hypothetical protein